MKKLIILGVVLISASFASCKKDFVCSCNGVNAEKYTISNTTKGDAGDTCDNYEKTKRETDPTAACGLD